MSPRIVNKQEKLLSILDAALGVFAQQGYSSTKMEAIARAAGIGKGTIYEYFRNKDALFFALFDHVRSRFHETIYAEAEEQETATSALEMFIFVTLKALDEWREFGYVLLDFWSEHRRGESVSLRFSEVYAFSREKIADFVRRGIRDGEFRNVDPLAAASAIIALLDGLLLQCIFDPAALSETAAIRQITDVILGGIRK